MFKICEASCLLEARKSYCFQDDYFKKPDHSKMITQHPLFPIYSAMHQYLQVISQYIALLIVCSSVYLIQNMDTVVN